MSLKRKHFYDFGDFRLDLAEKVLMREGKFIPLTPKVFETLCVLVENAGRLLEKHELMQRIWQDRSVEESNLTFNIKMLRKALGDSASQPVYIETVPRRGYRFIHEVTEVFEDFESKNAAARLTFQPPESDSAALPRRRFLIPAVSLALLIGTIIVGAWYARSKNSDANAPVLSAPFSSENLSTNGKVQLAVISPDGKNVVYRNESGGRESIWLRQLESADNFELIAPSDDIYLGLAFSPDGSLLYFSRRPRNFKGQADIFRVSIFGGVPIKIVDQTQGWISVSPDGGKISFVRCDYREDNYCSLWIADTTAEKNERRLASRPRPIRIGDNKFAPDGRTVAFAAGQSENMANEFGLVEVDLESGAERELTAEKFFDIKGLTWMPDRSGLLLTASRIPNKVFRIWQVSAAGDVQPMTRDSESYMALSSDKTATKIVATQVRENFRLSLLQMSNPSDGRVLVDATNATFAPGGKIIFSSMMSGNVEIWSVDADGTGQRQLTNNAADESAPIASPAGDFIFFTSNRTNDSQIWRMNADGSNQMQITYKEGGFPVSVSPDGKWLYFHSGLHRTLWRISTGGGEEQLVLDKRKSNFAISPDGSHVAFAESLGKELVIQIVSLADGQTVNTFRINDTKSKSTELAWTPDGKSLAYVAANGEHDGKILWLQSLDKEAPERIADLGDETVNSLAFSPDGKQLALVGGTWNHDAVLIKGLK